MEERYHAGSLYEKLRNVDTLVEFTREYNKRARELDDILELDVPPSLDREKVKKEIIKSYLPHSMLDQALRDEKPIAEQLKELSRINQSIKRFLPRRRNPEHNARVEQLTELLGHNVPHLEAKGIFKEDNPLSVFFNYSLLCGSLATGIGAISYGTSKVMNMPMQVKPEELLLTVIVGEIIVGLMSVISNQHIRQKNSPEDVERAQYLDEQIHKLYS